MQKKLSFIFLFVMLHTFAGIAQPKTYEDSINVFIKKYVDEHEVVKGDDRKQMQFYPASKNFRVAAAFERSEESKWFPMASSGKMKMQYRLYGTVSFIIGSDSLKLNLYQPKALMAVAQYEDHIFLPFTDKTSGEETYGGGRYLDFKFSDISNGTIVIDFNKAYNPYCAYAEGYSCPLPPAENDLKIAIEAGEKKFAKH